LIGTDLVFVDATLLQLDVTNLAIAADYDVIATGIDFGTQQLDVSVPAAPWLTEQLTQEQMLKNARAEARMARIMLVEHRKR
jgi:hypothetical protein